MLDTLRFDNSALRELPLDPDDRNIPRSRPGICVSRVLPTPVAAPELLTWVPEVAAMLGLPEVLDASARVAAAAAFGGNQLLPGSDPFASRYGGHQFGNWAGQLGDGRAISLGEVLAPDGGRWELQLKGAGRTPYSRGSDGRAVLRSSIRELICSEAMAHLGVPTTRALSLVATGDPVVRDMFYDGRAGPEPGAIVCRVAPSFLRFGHFEILAAQGELEALRALLGHTLRRHEPQLAHLPEREAAVALFALVCQRSVSLAVQWQRVGFVHGVLNTDNLSMLGLTIDYGPYGWLEGFDRDWTPNTTDAHGRRYRYGAQPDVVLWNLVQLANALYPLIRDVAPLQEVLDSAQTQSASEHAAMIAAKLGLPSLDHDEDAAIADGLWRVFAASEIDMTLLFRALGDWDVHPGRDAAGSGDSGHRDAADGEFAGFAEAFYDRAAFDDARATSAGSALRAWLQRYRQRLLALNRPDSERRRAMHAVNPAVVPRNYLAQLAIDKAERGDPSGIDALLDALRRPYDVPADRSWMAKRPEWARNRAGCSMLSCSS